MKAKPKKRVPRLHDGVGDLIGDPGGDMQGLGTRSVKSNRPSRKFTLEPPRFLGLETLHHLPSGEIIRGRPKQLAELIDQFAGRTIVYFRVIQSTTSTQREITICIEGVVHARVITKFSDITDDSKPLKCNFQRCTCKDYWAVLGEGLLKALSRRVREPARQAAHKRSRRVARSPRN